MISFTVTHILQVKKRRIGVGGGASAYRRLACPSGYARTMLAGNIHKRQKKRVHLLRRAAPPGLDYV